MDQEPHPHCEQVLPAPYPPELPLGRPEDMGTLRSRVARGSLWTLVGYGGSQALRLLNNLVLWRILYPEAFGLMALVNVFLTGISLFSDIGIGPSIVQHHRGEDPSYLNTAWTIQVIRELALCMTAVLLAGSVAAFYGQPQLATLNPAAALASLICGFNSTRLFTQARRISLGRLTILDLTSQIVGLAAMIGWAWLYRSIWSLIIGNALSNAIRMLLSHTILPGIRNRFRWNPKSVRALLRFGRWVFLSTTLTFFAMQADRIVFGKLIPIGLLGVYSVAVAWASMPTAIVSRLLNAVLFPLLSRAQGDTASFAAVNREARKPWLLIGGWAAAGLMSGGPTLIRLFYEPRATSAGWVIQILAIGVWFQTLENANGNALLALGQPKWVAAGNAAKFLALLVLIPIGYATFGFPGAVAGFAASELFHYATSVLGTFRHKVACLGQDLALTAAVLATAGAGMLAGRWLTPLLRFLTIRPARLGTFLEGLLIAVCVSVGWAWVYLLGRRPRKRSPRLVAG